MGNSLDDIKFSNLKHDGYRQVQKIVTLSAATNANGDFNGTGNPSDIFTVTGTVRMQVFGVCTTTVTGASATLEVGTSVTTAGLIAQTTGTDIVATEIWHDATPDASVELWSIATEKIVSADVILTVATADATAGVIAFFCLWKPVSADGNVVLA